MIHRRTIPIRYAWGRRDAATSFARNLLLSSWLILSFIATTTSALSQHDPDTASFLAHNLESLNSPEDDYAPFVTPNRQWLYFTSSRSGTAKLMRCRWEETHWGTPEPVQGEGVNSEVDDGVCSVPIPAVAAMYALDDADMRKLGVPTLGVMASGKRNRRPNADLVDADLYLFDVSPDGATLSNVRAIEGVNTPDMETQPTIAPDGSFIIFVADRSDGDDEKDLYISYRGADGSYSAPQNMGSPVNSDAREVSPFIAPDGRTLFFASDRSEGFGGADIYMSRRDKSGNWSEPMNLGPRINTSANELFFFGVGRDRCYFVSDRDGGRGGFDLYESAPNIFAAGFSTLRVLLVDSVSGTPVSGEVAVSETLLGHGLGTYPVAPEQAAEVAVVSGIGYRIEATAPGYDVGAVRTLAEMPADTMVTVVLNLGRPSAPPPPSQPMVFDIQGINVPLFVSGYYRLNIPSLLDDLRERQRSGNLQGLTYIADVTNESSYREYGAMANKVQGILDEFVERCVDDYFPNFMKVRGPNEVLEVTVHGYADPRPILGNYVEQPVSFFDMNGNSITISSDGQLDNLKLAGLRAYYAMQYLDGVFRTAPAGGGDLYRKMVDQGLIRWRAVSGSVDDRSGGDDLAQKRRIRVDFRRVSGQSR